MRRLVVLCLVLVILVLIFAVPCFAAGEEEETVLQQAANYYRSNFGIAFKLVLLDISVTNSLETVALLEGNLVPWPYLTFQSPTHHFGESEFGWLIEYGFSGFSIDKQLEPFSTTEATDRGTSADGWFLYAMPTLTWDPSDVFRVGFGMGGGIMSVKGDAMIYDPFPTTTRLEYDLTELTWGGYFLTEYLIGDVMIGIHAGVLISEKSPYDYSVSDGSFIVAYHKQL